MSDTKEEAEPDFGLVEFDPELVKRWFELDGSSPIEFSMPRVGMDLLYDAIHTAALTQIRMASAILALKSGNFDSIAFDKEFPSDITKSLNALRRFQMIVMSEATKTSLDDNWKVAEGSDNAE